MNRRHLLLAALLAVMPCVSPLTLADEDGAQALQWSWRIENGGAARDELTLVAVAKIPAGYIVYGSDFKGALGPRPSRLRITDADSAQPEGDFISVAARRRTDEALGTEYSYFEHQAEFRQKLRRPAGATRVAGRLEGQTCYETDGTCALFRETFDLPLP